MNKEIISDKQGIYLIIIFLIGTTSLIITGLEAKKDVWLAIILAMLVAFPMILIYARLHFIFPGKDWFDMLSICFGKGIGKILSLFYVWFAIHLSTLITMDFSKFSTTVSLTQTPEIIINILAILLGIIMVKQGIEVLSRWVEFFLVIVIFLLFIMTLLLIPYMNMHSILPVLYDGMTPVIKGAFSAFSFPFAELILFLMVFCNFKSKKSPYKIYIIGLLFGGFMVLLSSLTTLLVLGVEEASSVYFPAYNTSARLKFGFLAQMESVEATIGIIAIFPKLSICFLSVCRGISKIFELADYRFIVTPVGLLIINLSYFLYDSIMDFIAWSIEIWPYYAFPFQVIVPVIVLIIGTIKKKSVF